MNKINQIVVAFGISLLVACNSNPNQSNTSEDTVNQETEVEETSVSIQGEWKLTGIEAKSGKEIFKDCDAQTVWNFTNEDDEPLGDGTATKKIIATAPSDCQFFGFESSWTMAPSGELFIKSTRLGGMGGLSLAGLFRIEEQTNEKLVLESFGNRIIFEK